MVYGPGTGRGSVVVQSNGPVLPSIAALVGLTTRRLTWLEGQLNGNHPTTTIRILHSSDNHIDKMSTCAALGVLVDKANDLKVDLVLLAGDFFDNSRVEDDVVDATIAHLGRLNMPTVLLPGNHDQLDEVSVYHREGFRHLPDNLYLLRRPEGEKVLFPEMELSVWGRPTFDHEMNFRPLQGSPPRDGPWWHIGIAHGFFVPDGQVNERSSPIYAYEIEATGYDYVALGHSDYFTDLSQATVRAAYSGAPITTTDGSELGSIALISLNPGREVEIEQIPLTE